MPLLIQLPPLLIAAGDTNKAFCLLSFDLCCQSVAVQPYFPACLLYRSANSGCAANQNVRKDLLRGFCCCNRCSANPIIELWTFSHFSNFNQTHEKTVCEAGGELTKGVAAASSGFLIISHHWLGRRQHIVPPLVSPRQVFSTTVVQISCPAKLRDVHDERSPTDFCGQIPIDWWTGTMHTAP